MAIERLQVPVGTSFDQTNQQHIDTVLRGVAESGKGTGWEIQSYDPVTGMVTVSRRGLMTRVTRHAANRQESYRVDLMRGTRPSDGDKVAAELESDPQHEGFFMTDFDPYVSEATLSRLSKQELRCRAAVANALGVKPWDVKVRSRPAGGFTLNLPNTYTPSKHDEKLAEVASEIIGKPGWYVETAPSELTATIIPSSPPTFEPVLPYPMDALPKPGSAVMPPLPIGETLAERGDRPNGTLTLDFADAPHSQIAGLTGGGKSVTLNVIIAGALAAGAELVIIDVPQKSVDFDMWRPFVRRGGWGCESYEENATVLEQLYQEGERRAATFKRYGVKKLADLPADVRSTMPEVLIVVDEVTGLFSMDNVPKRLDADDPLRVEAESRNYARELIKTFIEKIAAEQRFVGYHLVLSTQVASTNTGVGTALRTNLPHKFILGATATDGNRKLVFPDVTRVPQVPEHVRAQADVARGVGVADLPGQPPAVFKSYFASEQTLQEGLAGRGVHGLSPTQLGQTRPSPDTVSARFPELSVVEQARRQAEQPDFEAADRSRALEPWEIDPETGQALTGFARANAARAQLAKSD